MTIKPVTSLADLEFKAKTDKHYQQLAILGCHSLDRFEIKTYPDAIKKLHYIAVTHNPESCQSVVSYVNENCRKIKPVKSATQKKKAQQIIDKLKKSKKTTITRKAVKKIRRHTRV